VARVDHANYRKRHFAKACREAGLIDRKPKDLRDSYASHLITAGISLGYVSKQLGHSDIAVTAKHYARWCSDDYRDPWTRQPGEVPADSLVRLTQSLTQSGDSTPEAETPTA
jgi:integrase